MHLLSALNINFDHSKQQKMYLQYAAQRLWYNKTCRSLCRYNCLSEANQTRQQLLQILQLLRMLPKLQPIPCDFQTDAIITFCISLTWIFRVYFLCILCRSCIGDIIKFHCHNDEGEWAYNCVGNCDIFVICWLRYDAKGRWKYASIYSRWLLPARCY